MKKIVTAVLAVILICGSFSGCAVRNKQMKDTMPPASAAESADASEPASAAKAADWETAPPETAETYIKPLGGLAWHNWNSPDGLHDVSLFIFCLNQGYAAGMDYEQYRKGDVYEIPSELFDGYVKQYFNDDKTLHRYPEYDKEKRAYVSNLGFGGGSLEIGKVEQKKEGDTLSLRYEIVTPEGDGVVMGNGIVEIMLTDDGYYYLTNHVDKVETEDSEAGN